jgi:hypothetical protein
MAGRLIFQATAILILITPTCHVGPSPKINNFSTSLAIFFRRIVDS